jgi:hypothetical protein
LKLADGVLALRKNLQGTDSRRVAERLEQLCFHL